MKVIGTGNTYRIYDNELKTYDKLPSLIFDVRFSQMSGFYLEKHNDVEVNEEKVYGVHNEKIEKVFRAFDSFERNLGIILSGDKGMGKSLFAKMLAESSAEREYPVLLINRYLPGVASFIEEIEQEVVVIFDEFDKTYGGGDRQNELLTLFDGFASGKKMFIITCNIISRLSDYFVNRTGRFHYHLRFDYPTHDEVNTYLKDKLVGNYNALEARRIIDFCSKVKINYDSLRAICHEINAGESFASAIADLNIMNVQRQEYIITLFLNNGTTKVQHHALDLFQDKLDFEWRIGGLWCGMELETINLQNVDGGLVIPAKDIVVECYKDDEEENQIPVDVDFSHISIVKRPQAQYNYTV